MQDFRWRPRTLSAHSSGSADEPEAPSSPSSAQSVPATLSKTRTVPPSLTSPPSAFAGPSAYARSPELNPERPSSLSIIKNLQLQHAQSSVSSSHRQAPLSPKDFHDKHRQASASFQGCSIQHSATTATGPSAEEVGQILHCFSVRNSPHLGRPGVGGSGRQRNDATSARLDVLKQLSAIMKGTLTDKNLDQFLSAYTKLRVQVHLAKGETPAANIESVELKARSLLREGADKLESAFRNILEEETRAVDARLLLRCASLRPEPSNGVRHESASATPQLLLLRGDEFPGFQAKSAQDGNNRSVGKKKLSRSLGPNSRNGRSPMPMFPETDESSCDAIPTQSNTPHRERSDEDSLPLFPSDDDETESSSDEAPSPRGELPNKPCVPVSLSTWGEVSGEKEINGQDGIEVPGVVWGAGTPAEVRTIATGDAIGKLKRLAKAMVDNGLEDACLRVYRDVRGKKVLSSLQTLDLGPTTAAEVEGLTTPQADEVIKQWTRQIKVAMHSVMAAERVLCSECLSSASWLSDHAFHSLGEDVLALLFPAADALAEGLKSEAKLVLLLDLYEALVYLMPFLEEGFPEGACSDLRLKVRSLLDKVKKAVKQGFHRFEEFILRQEQEPERVLPNGSFSERGLLIYVMQIIKVLSGYKDTLEVVFEKAQLKEVLEALLDALEKAIENQARQYDDVAQSEFFLMNNLRYIAMISKDLSFKEVLTDRWVNRRNKQVERHATAYQKIAWGSVLAVLDSSGSHLPSSAASRDKAPPTLMSSCGSASGSGRRNIFKGARADTPRDKLEEFSQAFAKVYWDHRSWLVPDVDLREAIQTHLASRLLDRYRPFLQQSAKAGHRWFGGGRQQISAFTDDAMRTLVFDLFKGYPPQGDDVPFEKLVKA